MNEAARGALACRFFLSLWKEVPPNHPIFLNISIGLVGRIQK
jgi:hypothetical protein